MKKKLFVLGLSLPLIFGVVACNNNNEEQKTTANTQETLTYNVTFVNGDGYSISGAKTVNSGDTYVFTVTVLNGYDSKNMVVKCNNEVVTSQTNTYIIQNVQSNLTIVVEGVYKLSKINIPTTLFRLNIEKITEQDKTPEKYLNGVTGTYHGETCAVSVDLSEVDFTTVGTYHILFSLVGHAEVNADAYIEIYEIPSLNNVEIDLANIYTSVVPVDVLGQVHVDFEIKDSDGHQLTNDEIAYSSINNSNYFTLSYLNNVALDTPIQYAAILDEDEIPFSVTFVDKEELNLVYTKEPGNYGYLLENFPGLPTVSLKQGTAQRIRTSYLLNDVEINPSESSITEAGTYNYKINIYRGNSSTPSIETEYNFTILKDYEIHDDTDLNSGFFFFDASIFSKYFSGSEITSVDTTNKSATFKGDHVNVTAEIIKIAKARGYKFINLSMDVQTDSGDAITSIPYVSNGYKDDPEFDFRLYWSQNECTGHTDISLDLSRIDQEKYPLWYMDISFRTNTSEGNTIPCSGTISNLSFTKTRIGKKWECSDVSAKIEEKQLSDTKFSATVTNLDYSWAHVAFNSANEFAEEGYDVVRVTVEGNNHRVFCYNNPSMEIMPYGYGSAIAVGGGSLYLDFSKKYSYVGLMTSHENPDGDHQDEDGIYGKTEDIVFTVEFLHVEDIQKDLKREKLAGILSSEANFWYYIQHNGWGNDCVYGKNAVVHITGNYPFIQYHVLEDMVIAEYTKIYLHMKAVAPEGKTVTDIAIVDYYDANIFSESVHGNDVDITIDISRYLTNYESYGKRGIYFINLVPEDNTDGKFIFSGNNASNQAQIYISNIWFE